MKQSNRRGRPCPRSCGGRLLPVISDTFNPNPKSKVDERRICIDCYVKELTYV